jgi:hypothetical protein
MGIILIAHRGNISGRIPEKENHPDYIDTAIMAGFDVEVDVWMIDGVSFLGHDEPQYGITLKWLNDRVDKLWIHCKNIEAVEWFNTIGGFNYFWHENDTVAMTSHGWLWAYPGKQPVRKSIAVMPEKNCDDLSKCGGICSDWIQKYKK